MPQAISEDDDVVLTILMHPKTNSSSLVILDAHTMQECACIIPAGLHSRFFTTDGRKV